MGRVVRAETFRTELAASERAEMIFKSLCVSIAQGNSLILALPHICRDYPDEHQRSFHKTALSPISTCSMKPSSSVQCLLFHRDRENMGKDAERCACAVLINTPIQLMDCIPDVLSVDHSVFSNRTRPTPAMPLKTVGTIPISL